MGNLMRGSMMGLKGVLRASCMFMLTARRVALHGYFKTGLMMLVGSINRVIRPTSSLLISTSSVPPEKGFFSSCPPSESPRVLKEVFIVLNPSVFDPYSDWRSLSLIAKIVTNNKEEVP